MLFIYFYTCLFFRAFLATQLPVDGADAPSLADWFRGLISQSQSMTLPRQVI